MNQRLPSDFVKLTSQKRSRSLDYTKIVVIDLEATCWNTTAENAIYEKEIIEVGVCFLDTMTGEITHPQGIIVKPKHTKVSPFCTELTSITQAMVDEGIRFEKAIKILRMEYGVGNRVIAAYGDFDKRMLLSECDNYKLEDPFSPTYMNISALAACKLKQGKRIGLARACTAFNLPFEGRLHRGIDDAIMAAKVLWQIIK